MDIFKQYLVEEFTEDYQEGHLTRREALKLLAGVTGSLLMANTILAGCTPAEVGLVAETTEAPVTTTATELSATTPKPSATSTKGSTATTMAQATELPITDPTQTAATEAPSANQVEGQDIQIPSGDTSLIAYLARPAGEGQYPVALVCHENRGLTEHIKDVTRRLAQAGYVALAVDLLSRSGGTSALSSDQVPGILGNTSPDQFVADFLSGWEYLKTLPYTQPERVGMVGFCFGGGVTWLMVHKAAYLGPQFASMALYDAQPRKLGDRPEGLTPEGESRRNAFREQVNDRFARRRRTADTEAYNFSFVQARELLAQRHVFEISRESAADQQRYGTSEFGKHCLLARRLLEHGVPFVQVNHADYDTHHENFDFHIEQLGEFDLPFATLVADLADRGLLTDTLICVMSEFGRTPKINTS